MHLDRGIFKLQYKVKLYEFFMNYNLKLLRLIIILK